MSHNPTSPTAVAIAEFLDPPQSDVEQSCLAAALNDAAQARAIGVGWLSTLGYLAALEVLGRHIKLKRRPKRLKAAHEATRNAMERALLDFVPAIDVQTSRDLFALRCSIAHQFGLINPAEDPALRRVFCLESEGPVVQAARCAWDGQVDSSWEERHLTRVNIEAIPDYVIEVVANARVEHRSGRVGLICSFVCQVGMARRPPPGWVGPPRCSRRGLPGRACLSTRGQADIRGLATA